MKPIPIAAARRIAEEYGYDQVIVIARAIDQGVHIKGGIKGKIRLSEVLIERAYVVG